MENYKGKKLFTPGPLCSSYKVKEAMLRDIGSRESEFIEIIQNIRKKLLNIAGVSSEDYTTILLQGSGTYAIESVFQTNRPSSESKVLILSNGSYGRRMKKICDIGSITADFYEFPENSPIPTTEIKDIVTKYTYSLVAMVHSETSNGTINSVEEVGCIVKSVHPGAVFFVDAMSSFGAVPVDIYKGKIDYFVTAPNKCLEGVPGFSIIIAKKNVLQGSKGKACTLSFDLVEQYEELENKGMFRFTPPTHTFLAFHQALEELNEEGGILGRARRYRKNCSIITEGMKKLGFKTLIPSHQSGYIITAFLYPKHPDFKFDEFYRRLSAHEQIIYPGKETKADTFRIGNIGQLFTDDMEYVLKCIEKILTDMKLPIPIE